MEQKLKFLTKELIDKAVLKIDKKGIPPNRKGKNYAISINNKNYPFKLLVTEAAKLVNVNLTPSDFDSTANNRQGFKKLTGYPVIDLDYRIPYFDLPALNNYKNEAGKPYDSDSAGVKIYKNTREKLQFLIEQLSKNLGIALLNNYNEKPNKMAGQGKGFVLKEYILTGGLPSKYKHFGSDIFIKLSFHNSNSKLFFTCNIDVNFSYEENNFNEYRSKLQEDSNWNIPVDITFPQNWDNLIEIIQPIFKKHLEYLEIFLSNNKEMNEINKFIKLLKHKKQIILQGPPGTGKTYTAKQIAKELTAETKKINPFEKIESFFKNFEISDDIQKHRQIVNGLNNTFLKKFKKEELKDLKLENYALGTEKLENFCYWIEYQLIHTGKYTGNAKKGKIYWDSENEEYKKSGFVKDISDDDEAMKKVAGLLYKIISEEVDDYPIGNGFVLKILNTYHPNTYFPINSETCLSNFLKLIKEYDDNLNYIEKNKKVQEYFLKMNTKYAANATNYEFMSFLFDNFDLKGNVVLENDELVTIGESEIIQFHPSYSYEDFVRGITVKSNEKGEIKYLTENKIFAEICEKAQNNKTSEFILIIDEINRANLPSVLGELIYALEYRGDAVNSMYAIDGDTSITIPENLYIIGTMNTADRSVGHIDYAIKRRFAFVDLLPNIEVITNENAKELFTKVSELFTETFLASDFDAKDVQLGHSYFLLDKESDISELEQLQLKLNYEILPILNEYVKDGLLLETAKDKIKEISEFEC